MKVHNASPVFFLLTIDQCLRLILFSCKFSFGSSFELDSDEGVGGALGMEVAGQPRIDLGRETLDGRPGPRTSSLPASPCQHLATQDSILNQEAPKTIFDTDSSFVSPP